MPPFPPFSLSYLFPMWVLDLGESKLGSRSPRFPYTYYSYKSYKDYTHLKGLTFGDLIIGSTNNAT